MKVSLGLNIIGLLPIGVASTCKYNWSLKEKEFQYSLTFSSKLEISTTACVAVVSSQKDEKLVALDNILR